MLDAADEIPIGSRIDALDIAAAQMHEHARLWDCEAHRQIARGLRMLGAELSERARVLRVQMGEEIRGER